MGEIDAITETAGAAALEIAVSAIRESGGAPASCRNCAAPMIGPYCAACGQPANTHRRSVFELVHDFINDIASFDSRILRTAFALMFRPGELPLAFRQGRTQRYVPAVRLYLFVSLIFFLALSAFGIALLQLELVSTPGQLVSDKNHNVYAITKGRRELMKDLTADDEGNVYISDKDVSRLRIPGLKTNARPGSSDDYYVATVPHFFSRLGSGRVRTPLQSAIMEELDKEAKGGDTKSSGLNAWISEHVNRMLKALATDPAAVNGPLTEWIPRVLFILLPLFALLLALFYWRQRKAFFFVDHLVFSLNFHTFGFAALLVAASLAQLLPGDLVAQIFLLSLGVYLLLAVKRFYKQSWLWTSVKVASVGFVYVSFFFLPAFAVIILISLIRI